MNLADSVAAKKTAVSGAKDLVLQQIEKKHADVGHKARHKGSGFIRSERQNWAKLNRRN